MHGLADDSGTGLSILWTRATKVCPFNDLGVYGFLLDNRVPVVFLGIFASIQLICYKRIYWRLETFWSDEYTGCPFTRITTYSRASVLFLPSEFERTYNCCCRLIMHSYNFVLLLLPLLWELLPNEGD